MEARNPYDIELDTGSGRKLLHAFSAFTPSMAFGRYDKREMNNKPFVLFTPVNLFTEQPKNKTENNTNDYAGRDWKIKFKAFFFDMDITG